MTATVSPHGLLAVLLTEQAAVDERVLKAAKRVFPRGADVTTAGGGAAKVTSLSAREARLVAPDGRALYVPLAQLLKDNPDRPADAPVVVAAAGAP